MAEGNLFSMEIEAVGRLAVEVVALDRVVKAETVRTVYTQLMGTARTGPQPDARG